MNTTVQKKKLHAKLGMLPTVVKIKNTTAISIVWRTTSQHDKTRLAVFGTQLFTLRLVRAHKHVSYYKSHTRAHTIATIACCLEAGVLGPCNMKTVEISWLVCWSQSVSIYRPCEQQTLNKKLFTGPLEKHLKFILLFLFMLWPFLPEHQHSSNGGGPWARRCWSTSLADPAQGQRSATTLRRVTPKGLLKSTAKWRENL